MTFPRSRHCLAITLVSWLAAGTGAIGQDTLARAKDLYVLAAYDEALAVLERIQPSASGGEATEIAGYQVFCLLALGRTDEAHRAIEALVKADPLYRPSDATASPRTRAVFDDVRRGLLPAIVVELYDKARASFDRKEAQVAVTGFDRVLLLLKEPTLSDRPDMVDLRRLAEGFRTLSLAAEVAAPADTSVKRVEPVAPLPPPVYSVADANVVPPVLVSRNTPPWRPRNSFEARREHHGVVAVEIDENGAVTSAVIGKSVHPDYDEALLKMARTWKFRAATKDGVPVKYRTGVEIRLRPSGTSPRSSPESSLDREWTA